MLIQIHDADKAGKRKVVVTEGDTEVFSGTADSVEAAHKLIKQGRKDGWASLTPKGK